MSYRTFLTFTKIPNCSYCGEAVLWPMYNVSHRAGCRLDRVNNSKGYTKKNCVVCCGPCNAMKSTMRQEEFLARVQRIAAHQKG